MTGAVLASLLSCDSIYDDPDIVVPVPTSETEYQYVNASSYTKWIYFNLHKKDSITVDYQQTDSVTMDWDIAIHRYDVKTNGGGAIETDYDDLDKLEADVDSGIFIKPMTSSYTRDVEDSIIVDMSTMMKGYLGYALSPMNKVLNRWLSLDLSTMPPIYTPSDKVYLILLKDETVAAIKFTGYSNPNLYNRKGYISFRYLYPLNFKR